MVFVLTASALAQQPSTAPAPAAPPARVAPGSNPPAPPAQLTNIRIEVVITETGAAPSKKTVSTIVADGARGSVRTFSRPDGVAGPNPAGGGQINVDVRPRIERNGMIRALVVVEYRNRTTLQFEPLLESGKALVASEAPDPTSDSSVVVAITATVLK
jgi:hypothetical protein